MSTHAARPAVDVAPSAPARPGLALALALLSIPGVTIAWDLSGTAGFAGTAVGIAAIVLGLQARSRLAGKRARGWPRSPSPLPRSPSCPSSSS